MSGGSATRARHGKVAQFEANDVQGPDRPARFPQGPRDGFLGDEHPGSDRAAGGRRPRILRRPPEPRGLAAGAAGRHRPGGEPHPRQARGQHQRQYPAGARAGRDAFHRAGHDPAAVRAAGGTCFATIRSCATSPGAPRPGGLADVSDGRQREGASGSTTATTRRSGTACAAGARDRRAGARRAGRPGAGRQGLHRPLPGLRRRRRAANERFWGIVSAVVDVDRLYRDSGLLDPTCRSTSRSTGAGRARRPAAKRFFGDPTVVCQHNPVVADVMLPSGSWRIAAVPKGGWDRTPAERLAASGR